MVGAFRDMADKHSVLGGKVHLYKRNNSAIWQCSAYLHGKNHRVSTREKGLQRAEAFAEDWYFDLVAKVRSGERLGEHSFRDAAEKFIEEYAVLTEGERNERWVKDHFRRARMYLIPFFGDTPLSQVTAGMVQQYRISRMRPKEGAQDGDKPHKPPSRSTLHHETVTLRQILKTAVRHGWVSHVPDISQPYKKSSKVVHRAWFTPDEYRKLYLATRQNIADVRAAEKESGKDGPSRRVWLAEQLHDKILFMANTGIRPDEANWLEYRDVEIVQDDATGETILEIEVRGKRGVGYCKSTTGAVRPFERMVERNRPKPTDRLFPVDHKRQFNRILEEQGLKLDRDGNRRTLYSLRHSYISFRLMEGANIYQIAKNCRTSVEMIEKHYAVHLKDNLDAAAINVRREGRSSSSS